MRNNIKYEMPVTPDVSIHSRYIILYIGIKYMYAVIFLLGVWLIHLYIFSFKKTVRWKAFKKIWPFMLEVMFT